MATHLSPGDPAPAFTLLDANRAHVSLADFAGQRVIVYFYPAAMTAGCTTQAVDFTAAAQDLATAGSRSSVSRRTSRNAWHSFGNNSRSVFPCSRIPRSPCSMPTVRTARSCSTAS